MSACDTVCPAVRSCSLPGASLSMMPTRALSALGSVTVMLRSVTSPVFFAVIVYSIFSPSFFWFVQSAFLLSERSGLTTVGIEVPFVGLSFTMAMLSMAVIPARSSSTRTLKVSVLVPSSTVMLIFHFSMPSSGVPPSLAEPGTNSVPLGMVALTGISFRSTLPVFSIVMV